MNRWAHKYIAEVDDLISKSNIHRCSEMNLVNNNDGKSKVKRFVGCRDNKFGKCKARFPRPVYDTTEVESDSGAINIKKQEPMINTLTPLVTYLLRCNTDITSLKSGTAIKGVILYVTDYITKCSLKTHVIFDVIRSTYQKNAELLGGSLSSKEKARKLMTKIVNTLSAKMEMGLPMICMYLLKHPDHYTSTKFAHFYWKSYVVEARQAWNQDEEVMNDKVTLVKSRGKIIGLSPVYDYLYRPVELEDMCLYDWVRRCSREKLPKDVLKKGTVQKKQAAVDDMVSDSTDSECDSVTSELSSNSESTSSQDNDDVQMEINPSRTHNDSHPAGLFSFKRGHPLYHSHGTRCISQAKAHVPNFIGEILPRRDCGDREWYCSTMLCLFKPWRTGFHLKQLDESWDDAFASNTFSPRQEEIMNNFNLRYECLDARDDFHAQLKKGNVEIPGYSGYYGGEDDTISKHFSADLEETALEGVMMTEIDIDISTTGKRELRRRQESATMHNVMLNTGWLTPLDSTPMEPCEQPNLVLTGNQWKSEIKRLRQDIQKSHITDDSNDKSTDVQMFLSDERVKSWEDQVKVVDKSYLQKRSHSVSQKPMCDKIVKKFRLNTEQARAFRIVANHAANPNSEQLKMYLGGMGGTGKTQVLKAIMEYFHYNNQSKRFVVVAPTGTAAALLGGSTYHYLFGFTDRPDDRMSNHLLLQLRARFEGVSYIFLDEVSMLSCHDMYRISLRLAKILNVADLPFGGMNMVFAGDFAQLPPPMGGEHTSLYSRTVGRKSTSLRDQESAIGKALWQQITTVVILRQNMRQKTQSADDTKLRQALTNLRYKACKPEDIAFFRTRISSPMKNRPSITSLFFRNVSIITALNVHKDEINRLGTLRYSQETCQALVDFYSEDTPGQPQGQDTGSPSILRTPRKCNTKQATAILTDKTQEVIWNQPPSSNDKNIAGCLSLCIGMPVIIRNNTATELCITRGQEATVVAWQSTIGSRGQTMLDTLFVKLKSPPHPVQIEGLPENVVPLTRSSTSVRCSLPNDEYLTVTRSQVEILPNFAMTDYSSQGKTRPFNPVDLNNCRSHQSYYTALSRSATAAGTCIVQGFDPRMMTGGASGALRQEFRELELLDDISLLTYESKLDDSVVGDNRRVLLNLFRLWKGNDYLPTTIHESLRSEDNYIPPIDDEDLSWRIVTKNNNAAVDQKNMTNNMKRKLEANPPDISASGQSKSSHKKVKLSHDGHEGNTRGLMPTGLSWSNNSCAYDCVLSILFAIFATNPVLEKTNFRNVDNENLTYLTKRFQDHLAGKCSLEDSRDRFRRHLQLKYPAEFVWGQYIGIESILQHILLAKQPIFLSEHSCTHGHINQRYNNTIEHAVFVVGTGFRGTTQFWVNHPEYHSLTPCRVCGSMMQIKIQFDDVPHLLALEVASAGNVQPSLFMDIQIKDKMHRYQLRGAAYFGNAHFVSRIITSDMHVWYHDGIETRGEMEYEGKADSCNWSVCQSKTPSAFVYKLLQN
jgi:hypothetical protein